MEVARAAANEAAATEANVANNGKAEAASATA